MLRRVAQVSILRPGNATTPKIQDRSPGFGSHPAGQAKLFSTVRVQANALIQRGLHAKLRIGNDKRRSRLEPSTVRRVRHPSRHGNLNEAAGRRTHSRAADPACEAAGIVWDAEEELSVNQLRQLMLEELQRRNIAATTIRTYLHGVAHFSRYFRRPPDQLGPEDLRKYQAMLFTKLKYSPNTVIVRLASLRFFYIHVLKRGWSIAETPYPKTVRRLP